MAILEGGFRQLAPEEIEGLRSRVQGDVIAPGDAGYDGARMAWNLSMQQRPAVIVMAAGAPDVAAAVGFAREADLGVAVQATGHGVRRPADGCLLVNTSRMTGVRVDAASQTAWVEAGTKWGAVLEQAQAVGLAPLLGSSPGVGAVGYTLGGGMGWLVRKHGLSADSVRYFDVVTADGQTLRASDTENADLFWGLRGGGGSLAIVTEMAIRLYPVMTVYGGNLYYPIELAPAVFRRYREWIASAPDELTSSIVIMNYPPIPEIPEFLSGKSFVQVRGCYCGPAEEGEALLGHWRGWEPPFIDDFKAMPFADVAAISSDPPDPMPGRTTSAWLRDLDDEVIDTVLRYALPAGGPPPITFAEIRHSGGAVSRVDAADCAYGNRESSLTLQMIGITPSPEAHRAFVDHTDRMKQDLKPWLTGRVYLNFLEGEEAVRRTKDGYSPENYRRLSALKAKYDPENRLGFSFAVPPAVD
jgi:FAD/FMN-containing dehydrogenase